ncbi:uncharacterized protein BDR25DRAFT_352160 [Lindgomyces ingoldianus]|uniref:Uncharacterized protein n=1 Tax=Lindgomyces ingoldianus TaxID=673940 RepID=A0ACB6R3B3_9PLEO|nr:uncharacterized protein BDR25DRAFT_352160 [Lindgomyces ingoldianus]KAF2473671.1 hypothetical protein BDR25DRAFT_352160 [Lindgomyces ingoldianus]
MHFTTRMIANGLLTDGTTLTGEAVLVKLATIFAIFYHVSSVFILRSIIGVVILGALCLNNYLMLHSLLVSVSHMTNVIFYLDYAYPFLGYDCTGYCRPFPFRYGDIFSPITVPSGALPIEGRSNYGSRVGSLGGTCFVIPSYRVARHASERRQSISDGFRYADLGSFLLSCPCYRIASPIIHLGDGLLLGNMSKIAENAKGESEGNRTVVFICNDALPIREIAGSCARLLWCLHECLFALIHLIQTAYFLLTWSTVLITLNLSFEFDLHSLILCCILRYQKFSAPIAPSLRNLT